MIAYHIDGSMEPYKVSYTQKLIKLDHEKDGCIVVLGGKYELGNEIYSIIYHTNTATGIMVKEKAVSAPILSDNGYSWSGTIMFCFSCREKNHKAYNCLLNQKGCQLEWYF